MPESGHIPGSCVRTPFLLREACLYLCGSSSCPSSAAVLSPISPSNMANGLSRVFFNLGQCSEKRQSKVRETYGLPFCFLWEGSRLPFLFHNKPCLPLQIISPCSLADMVLHLSEHNLGNSEAGQSSRSFFLLSPQQVSTKMVCYDMFPVLSSPWARCRVLSTSYRVAHCPFGPHLPWGYPYGTQCTTTPIRTEPDAKGIIFLQELWHFFQNQDT